MAQLVTSTGHSEAVTSVAFSPGGEHVLTGSSDGTAILWDAATGAELRRFEGHLSNVNSVAFSPDGGRVLTGSDDRTAILWDAATGAELRRFEGHPGALTSVAFSSGGEQVLTGSDDETAILWDTATGAELRRFEGHAGIVTSVAFSPGGEHVLTGSDDETAILWDAATGAELRRFEGPSSYVYSVAFSPGGEHVVTGSSDGTLRLWDAATGAELRRFEGHAGTVTSVAISPGGERVLTASWDDTAILWDATTGAELRRFQGHAGIITTSVAFSPDGEHVLTGSGDTAILWNAATGAELRSFEGHSSSVNSVAFSPDGEHVLTGSSGNFTGSRDGTAILWDAVTGAEIRRFERHAEAVLSVAFSADGGRVITGSRDRTAILWDAATGAELRRFEGHTERVSSVAFSPGGEHVLTGSWDETAILWDAATGVELRRFEGHSDWVTSVAFSPDGERVLTGSLDGTAIHWDAATGAELRRFDGQPWSDPVAFSPDGEHVLTGSDDTAILWNAATGAELRRFEGHWGRVYSVAFSPDGEHVLTGSGDGTVILWDAETSAELVRLISFTEGTWAVVTPDGRFDTNNLERVDGLHWVMPDDPFTPLPVEVFMRDYYEPRLLGRVLEGEEFPEVEDIGGRNRVQPDVRISAVSPSPDGTATVTVEVEAAERYFGTGSDSTLVRSGGADLRLFRDGQLVGWADGPLDTRPGRPATFIFEDVRLPRTGADSVTFSAYAFNEDRVKSLTDYDTVAVPAELEPTPGRAYLITVGVDAYESPEWNLRFAANDARILGRELTERLEEADFADVVHVPLLSDQDPAESTIATGAAIQGVLDLLAGRDVSAETRRRIPGADRILPARPEDLVLISFSGHGYTGPGGVFYMFPADIGEGQGREVTEELLARTISSDDLTRWLRDIDAGEMVLIVDACHSAAAVEGSGFKPGPMGSRGLGQLAYDKGMRVLAASQAADVALESDVLRQGLLTYALVQDGLEAGQADHEPADGRITLGEWLSYATERVPALYREVMDGEVQTFGRGLEIEAEGEEDELFQRPSLFDFRRSEDSVLLAGRRAGSSPAERGDRNR